MLYKFLLHFPKYEIDCTFKVVENSRIQNEFPSGHDSNLVIKTYPFLEKLPRK